MRTAIIIQARTGSKRFPYKILKKIDHRSVLQFLIEKLSTHFPKDEIIIATTLNKTDKKICNVAKFNKIKFFRGSKNNLLKRYFDCAKKFKISKIIRITSDCPLVDPLLIKKMLKFFNNNNIDYYSNTSPLKISKFPDGSDIEIFNYESLKKLSKLRQNQSAKEHMTGFWQNKKIFKTKILNKKKDISNYKFSLDYKSDLVLLKLILKNLKKKNLTGTADQIVQFINENFKLKKISNLNRLKYLKNKKIIN